MAIQQTAFFATPVITPTNNAQLNTMDPGLVFNTKGNDFLSPNTILNNTDTFSGQANAGDNIFGKNPSSIDILNVTRDNENNIFNGTFGVAAFTQPNGTQINTPPGTILGGTIVQTPSAAFLSDLGNFNPLMWLNPSASNVTLGTMDSASKILGGSGIFSPPISDSGNLFPFIAPQQAPFGGFKVPTNGSNTVNNLNQALIFPNTAQTGSPLFNNTLFINAIPVTTQPNQANQNLQPLVTLSNLLSQLLARVNNG